MYKVLCDGAIIHDPAGYGPEVYGGRVTKQANCADCFNFTIYPDNPAMGQINQLVSKIEVYKDSDLIFYGRPIRVTTGWENQETWECEGVFAYLNDTILRPYSFTGSVRNYLLYLIGQHNAQVPASKQITVRTVNVEDAGGNIYRAKEDCVNTMEEIQEKLIKRLGGYLVTEVASSGIYLDYIRDSAEGTGQSVEISKNLLDFIREKDGTQIVTALIPLGAKDPETGERLTIKSVNNNQDYIVDSTAAETYGLIYTTVTWDDITTAAGLLAKAQAKLAELCELVPRVTLTAVDLSLIDKDIEPIHFMDYVTVKDDAHGASGRYLITERSYNLSEPENDQITFGGEGDTISGTAARNRADMERIGQDAMDYSMEAIARATELLTGADGGHVKFKYDTSGKPQQILIMDTEDETTATKLWRWNLNGLGYSADGGEHYGLAMTIDGAMVADYIQTGHLKDRNGTVFDLNLDTGQLYIAELESVSATVDGHTTELAQQAAAIELRVKTEDYTAGKIALMINAEGSTAVINADHISLAGKTINLTSDNIAINSTNFSVSSSGQLTATGATISGAITATSGSFTGAVTATSLTLGPGVSVPASGVTGLSTVATSGSYSDLNSKPDLTVYVAKDGTIGSTPAAGATGFEVSSAGLLQASNAIIYGTIYASAGNISGWKAYSDYLGKTSTVTEGTPSTQYDAYMWAPSNPSEGTKALCVRTREYGGNGDPDSSSSYGKWSNKFYVTYGGKLHAEDAEITGAVYATSGSFTGAVTATSLTLGQGVSVPASGVTGLSTVATSGSYSDLNSKPDLTVYVAKDGTIGSTPAAGATGFEVSSAGLLQASNAIIYGTIYASAGNISGWKAYSDYLGKTSTVTEGTPSTQYDAYMWAPSNPSEGTKAFCVRTREYNGASSGNWDDKFYVTYGGKLYAKDAEITGEITSSNATITGGSLSVTGTSSADSRVEVSYGSYSNKMSAYGIDIRSSSYHAQANATGFFTESVYGYGSDLYTDVSVGSDVTVYKRDFYGTVSKRAVLSGDGLRFYSGNTSTLLGTYPSSGLATVATSGAYDDLTGKPTLSVESKTLPGVQNFQSQSYATLSVDVSAQDKTILGIVGVSLGSYGTNCAIQKFYIEGNCAKVYIRNVASGTYDIGAGTVDILYKS